MARSSLDADRTDIARNDFKLRHGARIGVTPFVLVVNDLKSIEIVRVSSFTFSLHGQISMYRQDVLVGLPFGVTLA